jgi:hypothetical protein
MVVPLNLLSVLASNPHTDGRPEAQRPSSDLRFSFDAPKGWVMDAAASKEQGTPI